MRFSRCIFVRKIFFKTHAHQELFIWLKTWKQKVKQYCEILQFKKKIVLYLKIFKKKNSVM